MNCLNIHGCILILTLILMSRKCTKAQILRRYSSLSTAIFDLVREDKIEDPIDEHDENAFEQLTIDIDHENEIQEFEFD